MKLTKLQIKEFIRQAIDEIKEGGPGSGKKKDDVPSDTSFGPNPDDDDVPSDASYGPNPFDEIKEGGPGSGKKGGGKGKRTKLSQWADDKKSKEKKYKDEKDFAKSIGIKESRSKSMKTTVKEVKRWMKTLEENRYRKIVNADARRVSWLVNNNLAEDYDQMPVSMKKKWPKAQYGKERYLAKEFMKSQNNNLTEQTLREMIRKVIQEGFADGTMKWENKRTGNAEVLGYKLTGKQDHKVKPNKLTNQVGFKKNI
jgi:hypothetical protein